MTFMRTTELFKCSLPSVRGARELRFCKTCSLLFSTVTARITKKGGGGFCSKKCAGLGVDGEGTSQAERNRSYRVRHPGRAASRGRKWRQENPEKVKAHKKFNYELACGRVIRPDECGDCGAQSRLHAHHEDYSRPMDVQWLCQTCHCKRHPR